MNLSGKFLVVDGIDGAGKGTQLDRLEAWITGQGGSCVRARDPGGTAIGDRIRHVLLDFDLSQMDPACEALLFMASRAQLVAELVRPALASGKTVLCDRFISATCAYQVAAGFPLEKVLELGRLAVGQTWPDLTIVLDVPPQVGFARLGRKPGQPARRRNSTTPGQTALFAGSVSDAMERRPADFHRRVRELFLELPKVYPRPVVVVDGTPDPQTVFARVQEAVRRAFG
jgi:dTMP kinase